MNDQRPPASIFLSYKREDEAFARRLHAFISDCGHNVWLDVVNIMPGADWDTEIHNGMRSADIVIGVLTPESLASRNVLDEWGYANSTGKRLFLLWLRDVDEADIPPRYIRIQRIDVRHDEAGGMDLLRAALASAGKIIPEAETTGVPTPRVSQANYPPPMRMADKFSEDALPEPTAQQRTNRVRMLEKMHTFWIKGVLEQSLHGVALLELGIQPKSNAVENPWDTVLQHTAYGDYRLPAGTNISDIYHDLNRELLILGDPGSGKTTTMLELARERIVLAEQDDAEPIPVILNLSSWADTRKPLLAWLIDEMNTKYAVPRKVAAAWLESDALLLLLDGLDEVLLRYRDACVEAINAFRKEHGFTHMVVCSRIADYEALTTKLHLNGAIVLQPLSDEQIDQYLDSLGDSMRGVREAMERDPDLRKLAETPLMLSIMTLAFRDLRAVDLPPLDSLEAQRRRLFETYTQRIFARRPPKTLPQAKILHYLTWLAGRMVERKQSVFYIENLQQDWIAGDLPKHVYRIVGRVSFGVIGGGLIGALSGVLFLLYSVVTGTLSTLNTPVGNVIAAALSFVLLPAAVGAGIFAISGLLAFALDSMPDHLPPFGLVVRRTRGVLFAGLLLGVLGALLTFIGLLMVMLSAETTVVNFEKVLEWTILIAASGGVIGAYAAGVALAVKLPRRRWISTLLVLSGCSTAVSLFVYLGILVVRSFTQVNVYARSYEFADFALVGACFGLVTVVLGHIASKRSIIAPYIVLTLSPVISFIAGIELRSLIFSESQISFSLGQNTLISIVALVVAPIGIGYVVGQINDHIWSAEALRWRWNWRWALVGVAGMLLLGTLMATSVISATSDYYNDLDTSTQANYLEAVLELKAMLPLYEARLAAIESEQERYATEMGAQWATIAPVIELWGDWRAARYYILTDYDSDQIANTSAQLEELSRCEIPPYYFRGAVYDTNRDLFNDYSSSLDEKLAFIDARLSEQAALLAVYPEDQRTTWQTTEIAQQVCEEMYTRTLSSYRDSYLNRTAEGLQEQAVGVIRMTLVVGLAFVIGGGVVGGLRKNETIDLRMRPNSGIWRTLQSAVRVTAAFGLVGAVIGGLIGVMISSLPANDLYGSIFYDSLQVILVACLLVGAAMGLALGLIMGGTDAVIKHAILRLFLQRSGSIPRNYAAFLDEQADRILLRKVGGGYIFIHRYLLEYYATLEGDSDAEIGDSI